MSRFSFSSHIPDFALVSYHAEQGNSPMHKSSSYVKLIYLFMVVVAATALQKMEYLFILFALTLVVYRLGNLPLDVLFRWYLIPVSFVLAIAFLFIFNEPGTPIISLQLLPQIKLQLTHSGLELLLRLLLRTLSVVTYSFSFIMTTRYADLSYIANTLLPTPLNTIFLLTYRFVFVILEEVASLFKALSSRGGGLARGLATQTRIYSGIFAVAFVHSFDRAERIAKAMEARGFEGRVMTYSTPSNPSPVGVTLLITSAIMLVYGVIS